MIIKGLFKRYERWNPVHPTSGSFWGMGIGIGCGVGWGPGFGPEVIGYVGAGCGIGFSVGFSIAGVGIGLPTNSILEASYNALLATQRNMVEVARSSGLLRMEAVTGGGLNNNNNNSLSHISDFQRQASERLSVGNLRNMLSSHTKPLLEGVSTIQRKLFDHPHDTKS